MIHKQHPTLIQRIAAFWQSHGSYMDILYAATLLYILAIVCLMLEKTSVPLENYLEEQSTPFLSSR